jgi:glutamate synthase domain-containing protein 3
MKRIKFIASPMGFGLGYSQGEEGDFEKSQADELIQLGIAELIEELKPKIEKATKESKTEKAVK